MNRVARYAILVARYAIPVAQDAILVARDGLKTVSIVAKILERFNQLMVKLYAVVPPHYTGYIWKDFSWNAEVTLIIILFSWQRYVFQMYPD